MRRERFRRVVVLLIGQAASALGELPRKLSSCLLFETRLSFFFFSIPRILSSRLFNCAQIVSFFTVCRFSGSAFAFTFSESLDCRLTLVIP